MVLRDRAGRFWLEEADYSKLRLIVPQSPVRLHDGRRYIGLATIDGATAVVDDARQRLLLTLPPESFQTTRLGLSPRPDPLLSSAGIGAFLNYQLSAERTDNQDLGGGFAELGLFTPKGVSTPDRRRACELARTRVSVSIRRIRWILRNAYSD